MNRTRNIPRQAVRDLKKTVAKLNRRARRNGLEPLTLTIGTEVTEKPFTVALPGAEHSSRIWLDTVAVTVAGEVPVVPGGWEVIAVTEHDHATGVRTFRAIEAGLDLDDDGNSTTCDHCQKNRRRRVMFYLRNEAGQVRRIGRTCVKDFLPSVEAGWLAALAEMRTLVAMFETDLDDDGDALGGWSVGSTFDVVEVLAAALWLSEKSGGYVSKQRALDSGLTPTAFEVAEYLSNPTPEGRPNRLHKLYAKHCAEHLRNLDTQGASDYLRNVQAVADADRVTESRVGILASGVTVFARHLADVARAEALAASPDADTHVGTVGERVTLDVILEGTRLCHGYYGTSTVYTFRTLGGSCLVWFNSGAGLYKPDPSAPGIITYEGFDDGDRITIVGTVKKHGAFRGEKQTTINRVRLA